jgi:hypothetical protein
MYCSISLSVNLHPQHVLYSNIYYINVVCTIRHGTYSTNNA